MGTIYDSFERELAAWDQRYLNSPEEEMVALCLLALEREELVAVGYREEVILKRLASMRVSDDVRDVIHHSLIWAWKDEEMHAIYVRGAILRLGSRTLRLQAFARQMAGAIAGWSSSVCQHVSWRAAPISRTVASMITGLGSLLGKVPRGVRRHLVYGAFRNFCDFNVDAEKTAWLCWKRMAELAEAIPGLQSYAVSDFRRVQADEERHALVFQALADALGDDDALAEGESAETLAARIGAISEFFLPRRLRKECVVRNSLGSGGPVWVVKGHSLEQKVHLFRHLLDDSGLAQHVRAQAKELGKEIGDLKVAIKPTFMLGYARRDTSMITDPALLDVLAGYLREIGCTGIIVIEARNIYDQFYRSRTVREVAGYFGIASPHYRVVDASEEQVPHSYFRGLAQYSVARSWKEADFRISFGKMRSHPVELAYLTVGNVEWMGGRCDEFVFAERQAHRESAIMMLLDEFPPQFAILDAYESAADGLAGVMGCPKPKKPLRFYAGIDALAVDLVAARHMRLRDPRDSSVLRAACHWFGNPDDHIEVIGNNEPIEAWRDPYHNEISTILSLLASPVYVMGSGRGSMFLPEMDTTAFPLIRPETVRQWIGRRCMRALLRLHHSK